MLRKSRIFLGIVILILSANIIIGHILSYSGLPGLPLSMPSIGFLIAHLLSRLATKKPNYKEYIYSGLTISLLLFAVVYQIEVVQFITYKAMNVIVFSALIWYFTEVSIILSIERKEEMKKSQTIDKFD